MGKKDDHDKAAKKAAKKQAKEQAKRVKDAEKRAKKAARQAKIAQAALSRLAQERGTASGPELKPAQTRPRTDVPTHFSDTLRFHPGDRLADIDPGSHPGWEDREAGERRLQDSLEELGELQERLYADGTAGSPERLLLIVQGMDTAGKGGIMRHVIGAMDPQGTSITAFKAPTEEERRNGFLWRIRNALPRAGRIGVFDRSQYEDVLVVRVNHLVPDDELEKRYDEINAFEAEAAAAGTTIVKVMLHISKAEQGARLGERLDRPDKYWKYNPGDVTERMKWDDYQAAYQVALDRCSTDVAPWFVVPADHKWYARLAVQQLVLEHLRRMNPQWPAADFDVEAEKKRLAES